MRKIRVLRQPFSKVEFRVVGGYEEQTKIIESNSFLLRRYLLTNSCVFKHVSEFLKSVGEIGAEAFGGTYQYVSMQIF